MKPQAILFSLVCLISLSSALSLSAAQVAVTTPSQQKSTSIVKVPAHLFQRGAGYFDQKITAVSSYIVRHEQELENLGKLSGDGCSQTGEMAIALGTSLYLATLKLGCIVCSACARVLGAQPNTPQSNTN